MSEVGSAGGLSVGARSRKLYEAMCVVAVIPAFNEAGRIGKTVQCVQPYVDKIIVVDDGSRDQTGIVARNQGAVVLRHAVNRGQGAGLRTGTVAALQLGARWVVHLDADGQHDPISIPHLLDPLRRNEADIVFGSRFLGEPPQGMPFARKWLLRSATSFNALCMGIPRVVSDPQSGMRAMTREAALRLEFRQDRMAHASEILRLATRSGLTWREVPIRVIYTSDTLAKGQKGIDGFKIIWQLVLGIFIQ